MLKVYQTHYVKVQPNKNIYANSVPRSTFEIDYAIDINRIILDTSLLSKLCLDWFAF